MQAVLLAGGKGTRLRPFTHVFPKPLMPLGDADPMPIIEVVLRQLARFGFRDVTVITGYLTELIEAFCGDGRKFGTRLDLPPRGHAAGHRRRPDAARPARRAGAGHQRRHPDDARLRRDVRVPPRPRGRGDDRLVPARGEDRLRRPRVRRRPARPDRLSREARVLVPGEHGRLYPRPDRLGFPDARAAACRCPTCSRRCGRRATPSTASGRTATGSTSAGTTTTRPPTRSSRRAGRPFLGEPPRPKLKIGRDQ